MDVRKALDSTEPYSRTKEHWVGIVFTLLLGIVVITFVLIVINDAYEVHQAKIARTQLETKIRP